MLVKDTELVPVKVAVVLYPTLSPTANARSPPRAWATAALLAMVKTPEPSAVSLPMPSTPAFTVTPPVKVLLPVKAQKPLSSLLIERVPVPLLRLAET